MSTAPTTSKFTVSHATARVATPSVRKDLDMSYQKEQARIHHRIVGHDKLMRSYKTTCADKACHRAFLIALVGEGLRFQSQRQGVDVEVVKANVKAMISGIEERMAGDAEDSYPQLVQAVASRQMFRSSRMEQMLPATPTDV